MALLSVRDGEDRTDYRRRPLQTRMKLVRGMLFLLAAFAAVPALCANIAHGDSLYHSFCLPCHGFPPVGGPETAADNPSKIQGAINGGVPAMVFLRSVLSSADIADIAAYLGSLNAPPPPPPPPSTAPAAAPAFDFSDLWWNPNESGWGLNLVQHASNQVFGVMYTYEAPNRPLWLVIPGGTWTSSLVFTGTIYRVNGPLIAGFDPTKVNVRAVGAATLTFTDRDNGVLSFTLDGAQVTKTITRQPF